MNKLFIIVFNLLIAGSIFFWYNWSNKENSIEPILIYPEQIETKIKPHDVGGIILPNSENIIYDNFKSQKFSQRKINLLPEPEQPLNIIPTSILKNDLSQSIIDPIDLILASILNNEQNKANLSVPDTVLPEIIDDSLNIEISSINENKSQVEEIEVVSIPNGDNKTLKITKVTKNNKLDKNYALMQNTDTNFRIQLTSVKSEALGMLEGERIQKKFPKILGTLNITIKKIKTEKDKFFYSVFAGPFPNIGKAKAACRKLSSKQQTCIVTH